MSAWNNIIFAVQDRSGTVAQLTTDGSENPVEINDTGTYTGLSYDGKSVSLAFTVCQVNDPLNFCISSVTPTGAPGSFMQSNWPQTGTVDWLTGANIGGSPATSVEARNAANAYCTTGFFFQYSLSRAYSFPSSPLDDIQAAIVQATDYLDQRYRFKGVKLFNGSPTPRSIRPLAFSIRGCRLTGSSAADPARISRHGSHQARHSSAPNGRAKASSISMATTCMGSLSLFRRRCAKVRCACSPEPRYSPTTIQPW